MKQLRYVVTALFALGLIACAGTPETVSVSLAPKTVELKINEESDVLTATVAGATNKGVTWSATPNTGTLTVLDETRATFKAAQSGSYTLTATSTADTTKTDTATVTVKPNVSLTLDRTTVSARTFEPQSITASVQNATDSSVSWDVEPDDGVQITTQGNTSVVTFTKPGAYTVTATSKADLNAKASAQATITPAVTVSLNAQSASLDTGDQAQFIASVQNAPDLGVNWSITPSDNATLIVSGNVVQVSASKAGTYLLTAASRSDASKTASAQITVVNGVVVSLSPRTPSVTQGGAQVFAATVQNDVGAQGVDWSVTPAAGTTPSGSSTTGITYTFATAGTYFVTATSKANPAKKDTATVTVAPAPTVSVTVSPDDASMQTGETKTFAATVTGSATLDVTWSVVPTTGGTLTPSGTSANFAPTAPGTYTITATSVADTSKKDTAIVRVTTPIAVNLTPASSTITLNQTQTLTANVTGTTDTRLTWSVFPPNAGSLEIVGSTATYTPLKRTPAFVVASSVADPTKSAVASINPTASASMSLAPTTANLETGEVQTFTATVTGALNKNVTWSLTPSAGASISPNGSTANFSATQPGTYTITAESEADPGKTATATVTVKPAFSITITSNPAGGTKVGQPINFTATVTGVSDTSVTWTGANPTGPNTATFSSLSIGRYTVTATANGDTRTPKRSASYTFNVTFNK